MDRHQVRGALLAVGLSPDALELEDVHEHLPVSPDFWFYHALTGRPAPS
ncbi:hypothetical protein GCM10023176_15780 [Micromonospora coerulea]|uniref:Uncharacterized protein n=1 Tax=Micromonospora coerulea TaxID=47856 RepID=A0ABP8SE43_9ACTN